MKNVRAKVIGTLVAALAVGVFAIAPAPGSAVASEPPTPSQSVEGAPSFTPLAEEGCEANNVCGYTAANFEGTRFQISCESSGNFEPGSEMRSARNRCGNKTNTISGGFGTICMNPGGDRPSPGTFAIIDLPNFFGGSC
jgi:Peptidase inhibitor family I36